MAIAQESENGKKRRRAVTRPEVLEVAGEVFARNGYRASNLRLVADRLNITRQALYYHFDTKDEILAALFDQLMSTLELAIAEVADDASTEQQFGSMVRAHMRVIIDNANLAAILLHERQEIARIPGLDATNRRRNYTQAFAAAYSAGVAAGALRPLDPHSTANAVVGAVNAISWWYRPEAGASVDDSVDALFALLSGGFQLSSVDA